MKFKHLIDEISICGTPNLWTLLFRTMDLGSKFICWWASLKSYRICFKHSLDCPTSRIPVVSSSTSSSLFMLLLTFLLSLWFHPYCVSPFYFYSLSLSLSLLPSLLFSLSKPKKTTLSPFAPIPLYRPPLVGPKSLLFTNSHVFPLSPIIPREHHVLWRFSWNLFLSPNCVR